MQACQKADSVLCPALLALAAIAAALAFRAAVILAGVFGAIHADLGGRLPTDAACEGDRLTHSSNLLLRLGISLGRRRSRTRRELVLVVPAALRFVIHHRELLLVLRGQVRDVLAQLIAFGGMLAHGCRELIAGCGTLILTGA